MRSFLFMIPTLAACSNEKVEMREALEEILDDGSPTLPDTFDGPTDTATDDTTEVTDEPCTVSVQWNVENPVVPVDAFVMPWLEVGTTCTSTVAINPLQIYFSADRWMEQLGDGRLGAGTEYEHLGVYGPREFKCQQDRCGAMWEIDPTSHSSAYPTPDYTVSFGFSLAAFAYGEYEEIAELQDEVDDEVILTAVVYYTVDGVEYDTVAQSTITITASE